MKTPDIYNDAALARQLDRQRRQSWDLDTRIDWARGVDLSRPLLPLDSQNILFPDATAEERLAISQLMGLVVASSIAQLEHVAGELRGPTWEKVLDRFPVNPEFRELGLQFYREEAKHSRMFHRYVDAFAAALGVEPETLRGLLPQADRSLYRRIYALNSLAGGMAMWWLIAAVEEESIVVYRYLHEVRDRVDPLYYQIHRAHAEEEARHKSYAGMMLQLLQEMPGTTRALVFRKVDFLLAEVLNATWTLEQLCRLRGVRALRDRHPFFATLSGLSRRLGERNLFDVLRTLFTSAPYISDTLQLGEHRHVRELLERYGAARAPLPSKRRQEALCIPA